MEGNRMMDPLPTAEPDSAKSGSQFLGFVLAFAACGVAAMLIAAFDMPLGAAWIVVGVFAWIFVSLLGMSKWGVGLWALMSMGLCALSPAALLPGGECPPARQYLALATTVLAMSSMAAFLLAAGFARRANTRPGKHFAGITLVIITGIFSAIVASNFRDRLRGQEAIERTTHMLIDLHRLGNDVESFRTQYSRLPSDEKELVAFRGKPMPPFHDKFCYSYQRAGGDEYYIECTMSDAWGGHWDLFGYIVAYYGPRSPGRIHTTLF
jgi:hypothetical protein